MKKIVVIDDEFIVIEGIKAMIKKMDMPYEVVGFAYDGIRGLEVIEACQPDIVITDIRIPGVDGLALIESAKVFSSTIIFIVISGYQEFEYARTAISLGVKAYIDKPITKQKLSDVLERVEKEAEVNKKSELPRNEKLHSMTEGLAQQIRDCSVEEIGKGMDNILRQLKIEYLALDSYKTEIYKIICMGFAIFFEGHMDYELKKEFPSFSEFKAIETYEALDAYIKLLIKKMCDKMKILAIGTTHTTILQLLEHINANYHKDIGLNELADMVKMNPAYLSLLFKKEVGISYSKYITKVRVQHAKELLLEGKKVVQVSALVGYRDYRYFCDVFKKNVGTTPNAYKGCIRKNE